jgi:alpha,alpha-trehalose phosphorylase
VNGLYEAWPIVHAEDAYGLARHGQTIVSVTDATPIRLYVDDEPLHLPTAELSRYERALDMQAGTLDRDLVWEVPSGKRVRIRSRRLVSLVHRHLAAFLYEVTMLEGEAPITIVSELLNHAAPPQHSADPRRRGLGGRALQPVVQRCVARRIVLGHRTLESGMTLACGIDHEIQTDCAHTVEADAAPDEGRLVLSASACTGEPIRLLKFATYQSSRRAPATELCDRAERSLDRARRGGFDLLLEEQRRHLDDFWRRADFELGGDKELQQAVRFNLFHLHQATARAEGVGVPAKGLTGAGYEGHYFWDTEIYVLPFLIYTAPRIARNLLRFRFGFLDKARARARELGHRGAMFPWRTINGDEASAYYAAGTAQYHINADIVYALRKYVDATGDEEFLHRDGAEVLVETARLWCDLGFYSERRGGLFCINGVTGPDEYNTVVNNNAYTNLMARENLGYAAATVRAMREGQPEAFAVLVDRTGLSMEEVEDWEQAASRMLVPRDEKRGILLQDDEFLDKEPWDFAGTPPERYPLLLHYHPLVIYRHRVIKQTDVVLALFLLGDQFTLEDKRRSFDFYDPLTTGDSSLSAAIQCAMSAELGYTEKAQEYGRYTLLMDLADVAGNAVDGCHIASMGGSWIALVHGLAGFRDFGGRFSFHPRPGRHLRDARFKLRLRGSLLDVRLAGAEVTYTLLEGESVDFCHETERIVLHRECAQCHRQVVVSEAYDTAEEAASG